MVFKLQAVSEASLLTLIFLWISPCNTQHLTQYHISHQPGFPWYQQNPATGYKESSAAVEEKTPMKIHHEPITKDEVSSPYVFDLFSSPATLISPGGRFSVARSKEWPTLEGQGVSASLVETTPCSVGLPHIHPTATELVYIFDVAPELNATVGMVVNGVLQEIVGARTGHLVMIPKGTIHYAMNQGCKAMSFIQFYNSEDAGKSLRIAPETLLLPTNILEATFNQDQDTVENLKKNVPSPFEVLRQDKECLRRCGLAVSN